MANQFSNAVKFLKAVNLLASPNGATLAKLGGSLGISRRSVFRLLRTLEELGFPIVEDEPQRRRVKTYRLADFYVLKLPNITIPDPRLTAEEIIFILAVLDTCRLRNLLSKTKPFNSIKGKLAAMMPDGKKGEPKEGTHGFMG
jgi:predicted DNA-binding transcriptional regulator YafY